MRNRLPLRNNSKIQILAGLAFFLISLFLRLYYIQTTEFIDPIRADAKKYVMLALNLYDAGIYSYATEPPFTPSTSITPGFPFFIYIHLLAGMADIDAYNLLQWSQAFLSSLTTVFVFSLSARALPPVPAFLLGFLLSVSPHFVVFTGYILTETLFTFLLSLGGWVFVVAVESKSKPLLILSALIAALTTLTRPVVIFLFSILLIIFIYKKWIKTGISSIALLISLLLISPWYLWSEKTARMYPEKHNYLAGVIAFGSYPDFIYKNEAFKGYPYREDSQYENMSESVANAVHTITERARKEPMKYLKWYLIGKPISFWSWDMMESVGGPFVYEVGKNFWLDTFAGQLGLSFAKRMHAFLTFTVALTFIMLIFYMAKKQKLPYALTPPTLFSIVVVVYFTALHMLLAGWPRYSVPAWPFFYLTGFWGLQNVFGLMMQHKRTNNDDR